jgi:hypothetical protein
MEDVEFNQDHSRSPLPEAGNDPNDPLRPEIDEENSTPNPTLAEPYQDMEVTEGKEEMPDNDDLEAGLSDNESVLSDALDDDQLDEQFGEFDASNIAIEERPAQAIDEDTVKQIGVHKRKRTAGEGEEPKKKKKRADKPRRKKNKDGEEGEGADDGTRKSKRSKKEGRSRAAASPPVDDEANLTPEERKSATTSDTITPTNKQLQDGSAHSTARLMLSSRVPALRAAARRMASTSSRWPTRKSKRCAAAWPKPPKPTTRAASVTSLHATNSSSCPKSCLCSTRTVSETPLSTLKSISSNLSASSSNR